MDAPHPLEELSDAPKLKDVFAFRKLHDKPFVVEKISGRATTTVVRVHDGNDKPDRQEIYDQDQWDALLSRVVPRSDRDCPKSQTLVLFARPDEPELKCAQPAPEKSIRWGKPAPKPTNSVSQVVGSFLDAVRPVVSKTDQSTAGDKSQQDAVRQDDDDAARKGSEESKHDRKKLRRMPLTPATFQAIVKRMSIHGWIGRLISRADVSAFERTVTEMPLYLKRGKSESPQPAIVYNCRTSNAWAGDLALTVTHFPGQQLTFAIFFGCSEKQENNIIKRLRRAGDDAAHPMLLVGIVADLEHARQMKEVDLKTDELETQIYQLDHETVASRNQSGSSNNQRNMEKRTAWLDTTHARNLLISQLSLLKKMQSHVKEFPTLSAQIPRPQASHHYSAIQEKELSQTTISRSPTLQWQDSEATMMEDPHKDATSEPELMKYYDVEEVIQKAGMSINDRLSTLIGEYEDKIRD